MEWRRSLSWNPGSLGWRVAAFFMAGSLIFALGSFPPYAEAVDPAVVGVTFFLGSVVFTSASYSQFVLTINGSDSGSRFPDSRFRFLAWQPHRILYWATLVQLAGTLFFNASTFHAMATNLSTGESNHLVWAPDFFGSIAFLAASHLAWVFVCKRLCCVQRDSRDWWVAALNYVGSIFFMLSALGAFIQPATDELVNARLANSATFVGALCFFAGAYLLMPASRDGGDVRQGRERQSGGS